MGNVINVSNKKNTLGDIFSLIIFLIIIAVPVYFAYTILFPRVEIFDVEETEEVVQEEPKEEEYTGPPYIEMFETIEGQDAYISIPQPIEENNPPTIVVYSHGSNTNVTLDPSEEFMLDLQSYGQTYYQENIIFAASNQHGANWGSDLAIQDTLNLINWIKERYETEEKVYLLGYSMGGLPTLNFATEYPELVSKIALLAPTTRAEEWNSERVSKIEDLDIQIWHGTADVNVGYYVSEIFINKLSSLGRDIPIVTLEGKTHWDIDTEYMDDILDFFLN